MTWKKFKKIVEAAGVTDEMEIRYFDVSYPDQLFLHSKLVVVLPNEIVNEGFCVWN